MGEIAVACKGVKKSFGTGETRVEALRGVDLTIPQGEFLLLMGPSGSGKTTLISIIAAILTPTEGSALIHGKDLNQFPDREKTHYRGRHIGFVFQAFNLIPMLTSRENASVPLLLQGCDPKEAQERANALLVELGMGHRTETLPGQLSGGEQQRVAIARAIVHDPDLIVCDEPTSALDFETGARVMELLRSIVKERHKTLIVVSHDQRIISFADRIVALEDGRCKEPAH